MTIFRTMAAAVALAMVLASCGDGQDAVERPSVSSPTTQPTTTHQATGVPLTVDADLDVARSSAVVTWWTPSPWRYERTDHGSLVLSLSLLVGDEDSQIYRLELVDDGAGNPTLAAGSSRRRSWNGQDYVSRSVSLGAEHVRLSAWDPRGVVSGTIDHPDVESVPFWIDTRFGIEDIPDDATTEVSLQLGQLATVGCCAFIQFSDVLEDSRCPPDVECVWEGQFVAEVTFHSERAPAPVAVVWTGEPVSVSVGGAPLEIALTELTAEEPLSIELTISR